MAQRPLTQQELKRAKTQEYDTPTMTIYNCGKSMIQIHMREPGTDFYLGEHMIRLKPGQSYTNKKYNFNLDQLHNLRIKNELRLTESE